METRDNIKKILLRINGLKLTKLVWLEVLFRVIQKSEISLFRSLV